MFPRVVTGTLLGVTLIVGAFAWRQHQAIMALQQDVGTLSNMRRANSQLATENAALREKLEACERDAGVRKPGGPFSGVLGNLRLASEAKTRGIVGSGTYFSPYTPFASLARPFVSAFGLTPEETSALKERMDRAERKIDMLGAAHASGARDAEGNFVITLNSVPEGGAVRDELLEGFRTTLGEERYRYFQQLAADQLVRCLGHFGAQERTITIKRIPTTPGQYIVDEQGKAISRQAGGFGRTSLVSDRQKLDAQLGNLAKLLPADF
jgi:hypothetical protein